MDVTEKQYVLNRGTNRIELRFEKSEYAALPENLKSKLKRFFSWSRYAGAWISKSTKDHYMAIRIAKQLGFMDGGKIGERLSFAEEVERKAEKAERRAERYEQYANNAEKRAEALQAEMNERFKEHDIAFFTQPIIAGHAGSERFARQRQRIYDRYHKGFEEYRKSEYFRQKAMTAQQTASMARLQDKAYLNNRIEECNANIRKFKKLIATAEEQNNSNWLESLLEKMEYEIDKLAYFQNALDEIGGVQYNKENIKVGYLVKIRGNWRVVVKANPKTVETKIPNVPFTLKYSYAEIEETKTPGA